MERKMSLPQILVYDDEPNVTDSLIALLRSVPAVRSSFLVLPLSTEELLQEIAVMEAR